MSSPPCSFAWYAMSYQDLWPKPPRSFLWKSNYILREHTRTQPKSSVFLRRRHLFLVEIQRRGWTNQYKMAMSWIDANRLNTLLDLKAENQRLQRKVMDYKSRVPNGSSTTTQSPTSQANPMYATSSLHPTPKVLSTPCQNVSVPSNSFDQVAVSSGSNYSLDFAETLYGPNASNINLEEASLNEGSKKKKVSIDRLAFRFTQPQYS